MTLERSAEILDFYGPDTMLLIGGNLLQARERIAEQAATSSARSRTIVSPEVIHGY